MNCLLFVKVHVLSARRVFIKISEIFQKLSAVINPIIGLLGEDFNLFYFIVKFALLYAVHQGCC